METAKVILEQIRAIDKWALGAWGAKTFVGGNVYQNMNGVKFQVNGTKTKRGSWVMVTLDEASDTYNVYLYRVVKAEVKWDKELTGVYCDMLVEVIDEMVG